jgi:hypothetical protein
MSRPWGINRRLHLQSLQHSTTSPAATSVGDFNCHARAAISPVAITLIQSPCYTATEDTHEPDMTCKVTALAHAWRSWRQHPAANTTNPTRSINEPVSAAAPASCSSQRGTTARARAAQQISLVAGQSSLMSDALPWQHVTGTCTKGRCAGCSTKLADIPPKQH